MFWVAVLLLFNTTLIAIPVVVARAVSGPPEAAPLLAAVEDCNNPCWLGIQPGVTPITGATTLLQRAGLNFKASTMGVYGTIPVEAPRGWLNAYLYSGLGGFRADKTIAAVCLKDDNRQNALLLGHVLSALGIPDEVRFGGADNTRVHLLARYQIRQIEIGISLPPSLARLTLNTPVERLCFQTDRMFAAKTRAYTLPSHTWRGAAAVSRYYPELIDMVRR